MHMKLCVQVERSPLYPVLLHRDGTRAVTYSGAHGDPSPPYTGRAGGGGTRKRERTRSVLSCHLLRHRAALSHDRIRAERGGTHKRHQWSDARTRSTLALCHDLTVNTHGLRTFFMRKHSRPSVGHALGFSLIAHLILILKGYL